VGRDAVEGKAINRNSIWSDSLKLLINGVIQSDVANLPYSDALIRGDGLFETILAIEDKPVALDRHLARLQSSAIKLLITLPADMDIKVGISNLLKGQIGQSKVRLVVLSDGNWFISSEELSKPADSISLTKFSKRVYSKSGLVGVKSISYGLSLLAVRTATQLGFDDSLFINEKGFVVETGFSNLLMLNGSSWQTPALSTGCLPGITRELLLNWFNVEEVEITYEQLLEAKALFVTSSLRLIEPVKRVDDKLFNENLLGNDLINQFKVRLFSNINP
jgi:branched-subunit amino acid aminotransferase/4-amino-4-deoxychorismate lyase